MSPIIASKEANLARLIGWIPLYLSPDDGFCGVSLNKSQCKNKNVPTAFISLSKAELMTNLEQEQNKAGYLVKIKFKIWCKQSPWYKLSSITDPLICQDFKFMTTLKKSHKRSYGFFHFINLLQTRSKGGPLLAGEDDTVILKRNETNAGLQSAVFKHSKIKRFCHEPVWFPFQGRSF